MNGKSERRREQRAAPEFARAETTDAGAAAMTSATEAETLRAAYLTAQMRARGERLLHQQCWCWGQDIRRAEGNLLRAYGFERFRPPEKKEGSSAYCLDLSNDSQITHQMTLWGFGFYYANAAHGGGIFVGRYKFTPKFSQQTDLALPLWKVEQLPTMSVPRDASSRHCTLRLLAEACALIEAYERWVIETCGVAYRAACLAKFKDAAYAPMETLGEWRKLRTRCAAMVEVRNEGKVCDQYRKQMQREAQTARPGRW